MAPIATVLLNEDKKNAVSGALGQTKSGKKLKIRSYPKFDSPHEERLYRKQHLAATFRVFADRGFDEGVAGHVSVRDPILTDHFCKCCNCAKLSNLPKKDTLISIQGLNPLSMHFSQISVSDLILVNEAGEVVEGDEPINAAAFAIHSEIHKARPDVHAACHAHSVYGKAFSAFGRELDMITQDALRFYKSHAVYNQFGGVVLDREEGKRIAKALGTGKAAILQSHGLLTVSKSIRTLWDGIVLKRSLRSDTASTKQHSGSSVWTRPATPNFLLMLLSREAGTRRF